MFGVGAMNDGFLQIPIPIKLTIGIPIAEVAISVDEFTERFSIEFTEVFERGIGSERGVALQTHGGTQFCVMSCGGQGGYPSHVYIVMEGATLHPYEALDDILRSLDLQGDECVSVMHGAIEEAKNLMQTRCIFPRPSPSHGE
jgi:hypothetical protein